MNSKYRLAIEYTIVALLPIFILSQANFTDYDLPYIPLLFWVAISIAIIRKEGFTLDQIGIGKRNLRMGLLWYLLITIFSVAFIYASAKILNRPIEENVFDHWHFRFLFIPVSFFQELIYRGFMLTTLKRIVTVKAVAICINTLAFVALHMFFPDFGVTFYMPLFLGLVMDIVYWDNPNLVAATISHSIINFAVVTVSWI